MRVDAMADVDSAILDELAGELEQRVRKQSGRFARTDSGNAELFASLYADRVKFDHRRGIWYLWNSSFWRPDEDDEAVRCTIRAARMRFQRAAEVPDLKEREVEAKWAIASESRQKIDATLRLVRSEKAIADTGNNWNSNPLLLATGNGIIDLETGKLRPGCPEDRINLRTPVPYDLTAQCPRWLRFLKEVFEDPEVIDYIQRRAGYSATGYTSEQDIAIGVGSGANGKGVFLNTLSAALGDYAYNMPFSTIELKDRTAIPNDLAALVGRRFVTASETNQGARLNEARVKALTGCDPVTARFLHCEFFTFRPVAKFWLCVNHRPRVSDNSYGFWRRVRLIPFTRQFTGKDADPRLEQQLETELPGILAWIVQGCLRWQEIGLTPPKAIVQATNDYKTESDPLAEFLIERCHEDPNSAEEGAALYDEYKRWANDRRLKEKEVLGSRTFGESMGERFKKRRDKSGVRYFGVQIRRDVGFNPAFPGNSYAN